MFKKFHTYKKEEGFSLIELMVSLTLFAIVMVVSTGTLITLIDANAKAQALNSAMTNLSFALDSITREIRMGYHYSCKDTDNSTNEALGATTTTTDCSSISNPSGNFIAFTRERDNVRMGFRLKGGVLQQKTAGGNWMPLVADDVFIQNFELVVKNTDTYNGTGGSDTEQPSIDVNNGLETDTDFNIQTHIVQRRLDIL